MRSSLHRAPGADLVHRIATVVRHVIGAPDYERYVAHLRSRHPGERPLSREEFWRERLRARYEKPGARCC